jgi:hypothetical protein
MVAALIGAASVSERPSELKTQPAAVTLAWVRNWISWSFE